MTTTIFLFCDSYLDRYQSLFFTLTDFQISFCILMILLLKRLTASTFLKTSLFFNISTSLSQNFQDDLIIFHLFHKNLFIENLY